MGDIRREKEILNINIQDIIPNRFQPRLSFDDDSMHELAQSISEHGIIQPLVVRRVADKYEIIAGERRYKAATIAGISSVPAIVVELNDTESAEVALIENIQRKDLSPIEEAKSYQKIIEMGQTTQELLAKRMGKNQSTIANKIRLLSLNKEVQDAVMNGDISERHARSLLALKNPQDQIMMLNRIIEERLTVRRTDRAIEEFLGIPSSSMDDVESLDVTPIENNTISVSAPQIIPLNTTPAESKPSLDFLLKSDDELNTIPDIPTLSSIDSPTPIADSMPKAVAIPEFPTPVEMQEKNMDKVLNDPMLKDEQQQPILENQSFNNVISPSVSTPDYRAATETLRETIKNLQKSGVKIDAEEFDFENFFQINIKLDKK